MADLTGNRDREGLSHVEAFHRGNIFPDLRLNTCLTYLICSQDIAILNCKLVSRYVEGQHRIVINFCHPEQLLLVESKI